MTSPLTSLAVDSRRELQRWLICGAVVVMAHVGLAAALANWHDLVHQGDETGVAMVIDLEPLPVDIAALYSGPVAWNTPYKNDKPMTPQTTPLSAPAARTNAQSC